MRIYNLLFSILFLFIIGASLEVSSYYSDNKERFISFQDGLSSALVANDFHSIKNYVLAIKANKSSSISLISKGSTILSIPSMQKKCSFEDIYEIRHYGVMLGQVRICSSFGTILFSSIKNSPLIIFLALCLCLVTLQCFFTLRHYRESILHALDFSNKKSNKNLSIKKDKLIIFYQRIIGEKLRAEAEINKNKYISDLSKQVSHDIRSPLAALNTIASSLGNVPEEKRILIRNSVQRINDIANNLLIRSKEAFSKDLSNKSDISIELISPVVDGIISEKRTQFRENPLIDISIDLDSAYGLFAKVNSIELRRVISNLINNAVEAGEPDKAIIIKIKVEPYELNNLAIIIKDNGRGIPENLLVKLGQEGITEGKENSITAGSGLGIYHAQKVIKSFGGELLTKSETQDTLKRGSTFTIILPTSETPHWFVQELVAPLKGKIVSLDDDISIHQIWSGRFQSLTQGEDTKIEHHIFNSGDEFKKITKEFIEQVSLFLIDLELLGAAFDGLDVIEHISNAYPEILKKTILVTSHYEEAHVRERCFRLGIRLIPKNMAGFVPIKIKKLPMLEESKEKVDAVLLDDDELVRMLWSAQAKNKNINLKVYVFANELFDDLELFDKNTLFYIDSNLGKNDEGDEVKGEVILSSLYEKGFTELFLSTGYEEEQFAHLKFIKKVLSKNPQF